MNEREINRLGDGREHEDAVVDIPGAAAATAEGTEQAGIDAELEQVRAQVCKTRCSNCQHPPMFFLAEMIKSKGTHSHMLIIAC